MIGELQSPFRMRQEEVLQVQNDPLAQEFVAPPERSSKRWWRDVDDLPSR
jgi:hypothetical protein